MKLYFGIDFGTDTNYITRWNEEKGRVEPVSAFSNFGAEPPFTFPNVIYYQESGNPVIGYPALKMLREDPANGISQIKRILSEDPNREIEIPNLNGTLKVSDVIRDIFRCIRINLSKSYGGKFINGAVISVPYAFMQRERNLILSAAEDAGLNVIGLIEEPVAAALSYGLLSDAFPEDQSQTILVFDLGGGTLDTTLFTAEKQNGNVQIEVLNTAGNRRLGGTDVDLALRDYLLDQVLAIPSSAQIPEANLRLTETARRAKEVLSEKTETTIQEYDVYPGKDLNFTLSRERFEPLIESSGFIPAIRDVLRDTLLNAEDDNREKTGKPAERFDFLPAILDIFRNSKPDPEPEKIKPDRILLVGGASKMPLIANTLRKEYGDILLIRERPEELVGEGAGFFCGKGHDHVRIIRKTGMNIGLRFGNRIHTLLPKNSPFETLSDLRFFDYSKSNEAFIRLMIYQGNSVDPQKCLLLGEINSKRDLYPDGKLGIRISSRSDGAIYCQLFNSDGFTVGQKSLLRSYYG